MLGSCESYNLIAIKIETQYSNKLWNFDFNMTVICEILAKHGKIKWPATTKCTQVDLRQSRKPELTFSKQQQGKENSITSHQRCPGRWKERKRALHKKKSSPISVTQPTRPWRLTSEVHKHGQSLFQEMPLYSYTRISITMFVTSS
jgi:hypothetical protein